ncbi:hypothetical protein VTJ83DRAFT_1834 [Remersonia thermophila]|uniref:Conserved oligomeric Golgi complex subunit 2 n=1 Tax=Remersonia thermophila TaxID=72144 RepID=A0ABR4DH23_9PEZI
MAQLTLPTRTARPSSNPSSLYGDGANAYANDALAGANAYADDNDSDSDSPPDPAALPFPAALARSDFLQPGFDPAAYLSSLHASGPASRHQTLEDLRAELRDRGAAARAELVELVNAHYAAFLNLGAGLSEQGGADRAADVRVAILGFRRAVDELRQRVKQRRAEVGKLVGDLDGVRGAVEMGRRMLELEERVAALEGRLEVRGGVGAGFQGRKETARKTAKGEEREDGELEVDLDSLEADDDEEAEDAAAAEEEKGGGFVSSSPAKLAALAGEYVVAEGIADALGRNLPFVRKMEERMARCRNTILLDLSTALAEARKAGPRGHGRVVKYLGVYRTLDAQADAVKVLKAK